MVFFVIELKSRAVQIAGIRVDPGGAWMLQVARTLLDPIDSLLRRNDNGTTSTIRCRSRLGGLLNFYRRKAA